MNLLVSQNKLSIQMTVTLFKGILVNKFSTSRRSFKWSGQKLETSTGNKIELCPKNSLDVRGDKMGTTIFANL